MSVKVFPKLENLDLTEYAADSAYEDYTGIVLDPEDKVFKTVNGQFHDKKDFYDKLGKRGFVVRKVFESRVFDWIEQNAKTTLEAYLMFSTAFSKWKGNNLLNQYYVKLLNDIPQLNREKIKGDPNSIGNQKEESVLDETYKDINIDGSEDWPKHNVTVIPEGDETNELEISKVKFDPTFKTLADYYAKLNNEGGYKNNINKYLQTSPAFIREFGKAVNPVNKDTPLKFYDPTKDIKAKDLYIPNSGINPYRFNIKIDGEYLKNLDGSNFVITKSGILSWFNALGKKDYNIPETNPISILKNKKRANQAETEQALLNAAADFEKTMEIIEQDKLNTNNIKHAIKTLIKSDIKRYIDKNPEKVSPDIYNRAQEYKNDLANFKSNKLTQDERKKLYQKYGAQNQQEADYIVKKLQKDLYTRAANELYIPDTIDDQISWLRDYINHVEQFDLTDNYTKKERLDKLRASLIKLENLKANPKNDKIKNKLKTDYSHPSSSPVDTPRTGYIDQPKGTKAKYTTTQADLGINQGIHGKSKPITTDNTPIYTNTPKHNHSIDKSLGTAVQDQLKNQIALLKQKLDTVQSTYAKKQTANLIADLEKRLKNESKWENIVNTLKEEHIPVVDDIMPGKHVNYNATASYANQPVDGVITNPGAIPTSGQFMYEDNDEDDIEKQWSHMAHDQLNQDLFEGTHLRPEVREALLRIAAKFQNSLGLNIEPVDVYFTGSSANFNYNEMSDIDLHLVYDFEQIGINAEILIKYFIAKKQVFNNDYDITIKGIPVEVGVENLNEPIVSTAIYSVIKDQWMLEPKDAEHLLPKPDMKQYYEIVQRIEDAIESRNSNKIGALWDELYKIRKDSLAQDGEYGHGNGLFKKLRNLGYLDRLKHAYYSSASDELSLEALKEII